MSKHDLLTRPEAASIARVHIDTLGKWIAAGRLPVTRLGRKVLISRAALDAFIEQSTTVATTRPQAARHEAQDDAPRRHPRPQP